MAVRLQLVAGPDPPDVIDLPWSTPLADWDHPRLVRMARGTSRHVVRFVSDGERVFALKETTEQAARLEYRMLSDMVDQGLPSVRQAGIVTNRGDDLSAVLMTRYLDYSLPYRYLFTIEGSRALGRRLLDSGVVLLTRLHLEGFYWGDCSLSNLLFRRDAGALMAYLVDAETTERHDAPLSDRMRESDVSIACENVVGGLLDLAAAGKLSNEIDPFEVPTLLEQRYHDLWDELTRIDEVEGMDRHAIERRIRRINELGFDVAELVVEQDSAGNRLVFKPAVVEEGHHARDLQRLTGLQVQENQARRLLNDIAAYGASLDRLEAKEHPQAVVAARWIAEVYEPLLAKVPAELRRRIEPPELFHELLEHRYYLSEKRGHEVDNDTALHSYIEGVLTHRPDERLLLHDEE